MLFATLSAASPAAPESSPSTCPYYRSLARNFLNSAERAILGPVTRCDQVLHARSRGVNLLFVICGIWYAVGMHAVRVREGKWPHYPPARADWFLYFTFLSVSIALIAWLTYLSVRLIRADRRALSLTCIVFGIEIAFETAQVWYFWLSAPKWVTDRSWFWTEGMDPLAPQFAFFYVFVGFLASLALQLIARARHPQLQTVDHSPS